MGIPIFVEPGPIDFTLASTLAGGQSGLLSPISFCHWQPDETTTSGYNIWALIFNAAQIAIAVYNAIKQEEIADKQMDLAEKWYSHADYKWGRFRDNYLPLEKRLLNETANKGVPQLDCVSAEYRAAASTDSAYNIMKRFFSQQTKKYRICVDSSSLQDINHSQAELLVDSRNYNYADDRWFRDYKDDQRWSRRSNMLNLGRNLSATALEYGSIASNIYGAVGAQYDRAAQSATYALGYFGARNDTYMPHAFLGTAGRGSGGNVAGIQTVVGGISATNINPAAGGLGQP